MTLVVSPIKERHLPAVVDIHLRAFPGFFLTFLGRGFLHEFYRSFCGSQDGVGLVAVNRESGEVVGFVVGPLHPAGYFKRLLRRRWWAFCLRSLGAVLRRPRTVSRLMRALRYRGDAPPEGDRALLSSIAVDPHVQCSGVGRLLVQAFLDKVREAGLTGAFLTTDQAGNDRVNKFYRDLGWTLEGSYVTPEGRPMNRYVRDFGCAPVDAI